MVASPRVELPFPPAADYHLPLFPPFSHRSLVHTGPRSIGKAIVTIKLSPRILLDVLSLIRSVVGQASNSASNFTSTLRIRFQTGLLALCDYAAAVAAPFLPSPSATVSTSLSRRRETLGPVTAYIPESILSSIIKYASDRTSLKLVGAEPNQATLTKTIWMFSSIRTMIVDSFADRTIICTLYVHGNYESAIVSTQVAPPCSPVALVLLFLPNAISLADRLYVDTRHD